MDNFGLVLKGMCTVTAIILGFLFPAELIDALKLTDEEKARDAGARPVPVLGFW